MEIINAYYNKRYKILVVYGKSEAIKYLFIYNFKYQH